VKKYIILIQGEMSQSRGKCPVPLKTTGAKRHRRWGTSKYRYSYDHRRRAD